MQTQESVRRRRGVRWGRLLSAVVATAGIAIYLPVQQGLAQPATEAPATEAPATEASAADTAAAEEQQPVIVTKIYDVGDLSFDIPNFVGPDSPAVTREDEELRMTTEERIELLTQLIQDTVQPDTWRDVGGSTGSVRSISDRQQLLVISHTADAHQQIEAVLQQLRQQMLRVIRVRAHWIVTDHATIATLTATPGDKKPTLRTTTDDAIDKSPNILAHLRGEIVCMDGQRTAIATFRGVSAVTDVSPSVGERAAAFDPSISLISTGAVIDVHPKLVPGGAAAMLTVRARVADGTVTPAPADITGMATTRQKPTTRPTMNALNPTGLVDRTVEENHGFHTSLQMPVGKMVLVGGMALEAAHLLNPVKQAEEGRPIDPPQLYLFLEICTDDVAPGK